MCVYARACVYTYPQHTPEKCLMLTTLSAAGCSRDAGKGDPRKPRLGWSSPKLSHSPRKVQACDGQRETTSSIRALGTHATQAAFGMGSWVCLHEIWWHYNCCVEIHSAVSLSLTCFFLMQLSCSLYFSFWLPCVLSFTFCWGCLSWDERKKNCVPGFGKRRKTAWVLLQERIHLEQPFSLMGIVKAWQNLWVRILTPGTTLLSSHLPLLPTATIPGSACPKLSLSEFPASVYFPDCRKLLQTALDSINLNLRALGDPSYGCRVKSL